jgi:hypothetical protein
MCTARESDRAVMTAPAASRLCTVLVGIGTSTELGMDGAGRRAAAAAAATAQKHTRGTQ